MSKASDIAKAVLAAINDAPDGTFAESFTAERSVFVDPERSDLSGLRVDVVTRSMETKQETRGGSANGHAVFVVIQKPAPDGAITVEGMDAFIDLVEQFVEYLGRNNLTAGDATATWQGTEVSPLYAHSLAQTQHRYLSTLVINYQV